MIRIQFSQTGRIARSRMMWEGPLVQMETPTTKENRGDEIARPQENRQTAIKKGGLH